MYWNLFWMLGEACVCVCVYDLKLRMHIGPTVLNPYRPTILVGQAKKPIFNDPTPLFVYDNKSIEKTWNDFVLILTNSWFGTEPISSYAFTYNSNNDNRGTYMITISRAQSLRLDNEQDIYTCSQKYEEITNDLGPIPCFNLGEVG